MTLDEFPDDDAQYQDVTIARVDADQFSDGGWGVKFDTGWSFYVPPDSPVRPEPGMAYRTYGRGIGYAVRGLFLDGRRVHYRTESQADADHEAECREREKERRYDFEKNRADYDRRYRELPEPFRARLDRFRANNPDFRWEFEPYEMFVIEQAVILAEHFRARSGASEPDADPLARMNNFRELPWDLQKAAVPGLDDGHSGNTFGCAMALAHAYLARPEDVARMHGAMSPVVGSVAYGDVPGEFNEND